MKKRIAAVCAASAIAVSGVAAPAASADQPNRGCKGAINAWAHHDPSDPSYDVKVAQVVKHCTPLEFPPGFPVL